jgi:hypothetical protein
MIYITSNQLMNKPIYQKCQNWQLMVYCGVISLLCIGYQDIYNTPFMFGIEKMDK